ncbi:MAG: hypothetical protein JWM41_3141 [Gemmatimonadetes bacterium]|nr:hypothetical protein [Gemmatimonadota bacterium]
MRRPPLLPVVCWLLFLGASCSPATDVGPPGDGLPDFQTDSVSYTFVATSVGYTGTIGVTYTNKTNETANFVNCLGGTDVQLQKLTNGEWKTVWSPVLLTCLSPPIVVAPGQEYRSRISVFAGYPGSNFLPTFVTTDISGSYRAVWTQVVTGYQDKLSFGTPLPAEHRVSNQFTIVAPARSGS